MTPREYPALDRRFPGRCWWKELEALAFSEGCVMTVEVRSARSKWKISCNVQLTTTSEWMPKVSFLSCQSRGSCWRWQHPESWEPRGHLSPSCRDCCREDLGPSPGTVGSSCSSSCQGSPEQLGPSRHIHMCTPGMTTPSDWPHRSMWTEILSKC